MNSNLLELMEIKIVNNLFFIERMDYKGIISILKNPITISNYYKESGLNTDNAWIEMIALNFHDEASKVLSKISLMVKIFINNLF